MPAYESSIAILEALSRAVGADADAKHHLAELYGKLAEVHLRLNDTDKALAALRQAEARMADLVKLSPGNADWKSDLAKLDNQIAALTNGASATNKR